MIKAVTSEKPITRIMHTMLRVQSIERSLKFYCDVLGMKMLKQEYYPSGKFKLCYVGFDDMNRSTVISLTENEGKGRYIMGENFGHIAIEAENIYEACRNFSGQGITLVREPAPMTHTATDGACDTIAFIEDPDKNRIEIIQKN